MPEVSVIIPYHESSGQDRLNRAIESIEKQRVDTEIIVIEDEEGNGPAWARNKGLDRATNRYVAFCDADDWWCERKLEQQLSGLYNGQAQVSFEGNIDRSDELYYEILLGDVNSSMSSILIDTDHINARFDEQLPRREDHLFLVESIKQADNVWIQPDLINVEKHEGGLSQATTAMDNARSDEMIATALEKRVPEAKHCVPYLRRRAAFIRGRELHFKGDYQNATSDLVYSLSLGEWRSAPALLMVGFHAISPLHPRDSSGDILTKAAKKIS